MKTAAECGHLEQRSRNRERKPPRFLSERDMARETSEAADILMIIIPIQENAPPPMAIAHRNRLHLMALNTPQPTPKSPPNQNLAQIILQVKR